MKKELLRQSIHLVGILFVLAAQFLTKAQAILMFFMIGMAFLAYSQYIQVVRKQFFGLRKIMMKFERGNESWPFTGAIWFYTGCFFSFLLFPFPIASAASATLAIGDGLSTLVGKGIGRHKVCGHKTLEGFLGFVIGSFLISLIWVKPWLAVIGAVVGGLIELGVSAKEIDKHRRRGWIDDNWLIPVGVGFVLFVLSFLTESL